MKPDKKIIPAECLGCFAAEKCPIYGDPCDYDVYNTLFENRKQQKP